MRFNLESFGNSETEATERTVEYSDTMRINEMAKFYEKPKSDELSDDSSDDKSRLDAYTKYVVESPKDVFEKIKELGNEIIVVDLSKENPEIDEIIKKIEEYSQLIDMTEDITTLEYYLSMLVEYRCQSDCPIYLLEETIRKCESKISEIKTRIDSQNVPLESKVIESNLSKENPEMNETIKEIEKYSRFIDGTEAITTLEYYLSMLEEYRYQSDCPIYLLEKAIRKCESKISQKTAIRHISLELGSGGELGQGGELGIIAPQKKDNGSLLIKRKKEFLKIKDTASRNEAPSDEFKKESKPGKKVEVKVIKKKAKTDPRKITIISRRNENGLAEAEKDEIKQIMERRLKRNSLTKRK